ncbi:hypothetical protein [Halocatena halophila]|uniref:hypothetical protein n=1 Tax=Halocatena halophila TaxID=2814576 RepID=UPI002ED3A659
MRDRSGPAVIDRLCGHSAQLRVIFGICCAFTVVVLGSLFVTTDSATVVIALIDLVTLGVLGAITGGTLIACARYESTS